MRACGIAFARLRMPYAVAALPRGGAGLRNEKTFLPFAEAFGDSAKSFCGRLRLPALCGARLFRSEARRIRDFATLPDRRGAHSRRGGPLCVRSGLRRRRLRVCGYWVRNADGRCCLRGMSFRRAGAGKMCSSDTALRENRKKGQPARDGRRHFCRRPQRRFCARFGRLRLLAGKHVCVPTALSAADAESR